jgi:hypothetical protein
MINLENDSDIINCKKELEILNEIKNKLKNELEIEKYNYNEIIKYNTFLKKKYETEYENLREKTYNKELQNKIYELEFEIKNLKDNTFLDYIYDLFR